MELDDVIYLACLLACIGAGNYFKQIPDETQKKFLSTGFGLIIVFLLSGWHIFHCLISAAMGAVAVIYVHPSKCHVAAFATMFGYLTFFRLGYLFGLSPPSGHTNMIQMILTLKVAGVGFEKTAAWKKLQQRTKEQADMKPAEKNGQLVEITDYDVEIQTINIVDIFYYSFNYIGVLTGPYYRYRTYRDYYDTPFKDYAPTIQITVEKLKLAGFYGALYLVTNYFYPLSYVLTDEFYRERSFFYRLMYMWPLFFSFRTRIYTGLTLSECVCTMAGFGAYPDESEVVHGEGPKKQYQHLKRNANMRSYNFIAIENVQIWGVETCKTFRETIKHWNICVQYWLAVNVYKLFPSKKYRLYAIFICSAFWHGFRPGHYFCLLGGAFYVPVEDLWNNLVRKDATGLKRQIIDIIFWIAKFCTFNYLGTAFQLASFSNIWKFYSSVYHIGYIVWAMLLSLGIYLTKQKKAAEKESKFKENLSVGETVNLPKEKAQ